MTKAQKGADNMLSAFIIFFALAVPCREKCFYLQHIKNKCNFNRIRDKTK